MGFSGIGFWELLLILVVVLLLFGSKRLPGIASDLGSAIRDFRRSVSSGGPAGADEAPSGRDQPQDFHTQSDRPT
ncbi:twin arginine-targeting protein translocase, TatA/E family [Thiocystis violascens DSM 198]|uniref:Sec-independent protein translocase protein TatA n=2 Tax=Thiocystis violascens TaxID=73141 RepID=I3Y580_THIV6|nr:twin-arginine translocase TatA/TatE family subunit [Thiocystis violascens]AFL72148.1 twin arginine-targeting protein translocase, TatA/E family [Thiocystis violascens DSM 198]